MVLRAGKGRLGKWTVTANEYASSFKGSEDDLKLTVVMAAQLHEHAKNIELDELYGI